MVGRKNWQSQVWYASGLISVFNLEPPTGTVEEFYEDGQLESRTNYKDGKQDGLWEVFGVAGGLIRTMTYKDEELIEENPNP